MLARILLVVCGLIAVVLLLTMAIIAAAPWIALAIVLVGVFAFLWFIDYPSDKKPP